MSWILGLLGLALLVGSNNGDAAGGLIKASHGNCNLCGGRNSTAKIVDEYRQGGHSCVVVRFRCNRCGRTWTKTYEVT